MKYIEAAFSKINGTISKSLVLYLCKNRDREVKRKELLEKLGLDLTEAELEQRLKEDQHFLSFTQNLPKDFHFCRYSFVWSYTANPEKGHDLQVDLFARAVDYENYSVIGEVKNRSKKKFSLAEAKAFQEKFEIIQQKESLSKVVGFVFSRKGFYKNTEAYLKNFPNRMAGFLSNGNFKKIGVLKNHF